MSEQTPLKFCVNCKHFQKYESKVNIGATSTHHYQSVVDNCLSPLRPMDMVNGIPVAISAGLARTLDLTGCGKDAKWFEPKESEDLDDLSKIPFGANHGN